MSALPVSPLAPQTYPAPAPLKGVRLGTGAASIKYKNRADVLLLAFDEPVAVAGVFTRSLCPSAPVDWCRQHVKRGTARGLVVNSGNANAFTGKKGAQAAAQTARAAAKALGCKAQDIFLASTGVIGEPLDAEKIAAVLPGLAKGGASWMDAARAIMTTDTFPKLAERTIKTRQGPVRLVGFAKGSGMIAPDMATMLAFVVTDAAIKPAALQSLLRTANETTFNAVTVDGDTSTSDTLLCFATGASQVPCAPTTTEGRAFAAALQDVLRALAVLVARDGEGARKLVNVVVEGAAHDKAAKRIAASIANSPLVKTAIAGEDANWGRVVMAVGKAGERALRDKLSIYFGPHRVAHRGLRDPAYSETAVSAYMKSDEIVIRVTLGIGKGSARMWTCDLTKGYVAINGDYRS